MSFTFNHINSNDILIKQRRENLNEREKKKSKSYISYIEIR